VSVTRQTDQPLSEFRRVFQGGFTSALRWHQLDELWERVRAEPRGWFIYAVGEPPPREAADPAALQRFVGEIDALLRREHQEDFCGIVYADDRDRPTMIKIYDPGNLGVVCGYSDNPPLPGWVVSRLPPEDLAADPAPGNRRRWWRQLFGRK
jgi:hypothetical protein